ncbi:MAG: HAMP domain-containing protein [Burkholderiales bacterium]|nr:HAMP domain-containing protein [Burkholderiales bacterium]
MPKSLFGRLILILAGGVIAGQILSAALQISERENSLSKIIWTNAAQEISAYIRLLEAMDPADRKNATERLDGAPLFVALEKRFGNEPMRGGDAVRLSGILHQRLGQNRTIHLFSTGEKVPFYWPEHASFDMETQLKDGQWIFFSYRRPVSHTFPERLFTNLAILVGIILVLSLIAVHWVTRPLNILVQAADELGKNINRPPLPERGSSEMQHAARVFNTMQTRLLEYLQSRARIHAAMSHDLKTPITRLRLRAEFLEDAELKAKFIKDLEEMDTMVTTSLNLMRGIGNGEPTQPIDITALIESIQDDQMEMGGSVEIHGTAKTHYSGRPQALKRAISNLVENAIKYGQRAIISIEEDADMLKIRIRDEGPGIPEDKLELVTEPFYRLETSRCRDTGGTGLGLSISKAIAETHRGTLLLANYPEGGLEATLALPLRT